MSARSAQLALLLAALLALAAGECQQEDCRQEDEQSLLQVSLDMARRDQLAQPSASSPYRQTLANYGDLQYTGTVTLGGQDLAGVLDTGSFEILVFSKDCFTCGKAGGSNGYDHRASSGYVAGQLVKTHVYGSGSAMSYDGIDSFAAGPLAVRRQDFWEAMDAQMPVLQSATFQAIVGLGPPGEPQRGARRMLSSAATILANASSASQWQLDRAKQDVKIAELVLQKNDSLLLNLGITHVSACFEWALGAPGYVVWGDTPPQNQLVPFTRVDVISEIHWSLNLTMSRFEGPEGVIDLGCGSGCEAVMDTGTSLIAVPTTIFNMALNNLNQLDANCTNMGQMPNLLFNLGGQQYSLPPQSYIGVVEGSTPSDPQRWMPGNRPQAKACELLLLDSGPGSTNLGPMWILGMPFFRYYYTTFDLGPDPLMPSSRKIWTAPASANCTPASQASHLTKISYARSQPLWRIDGSRIRFPRMRKQRSPSADLAASKSREAAPAEEESLAFRGPPQGGLSPVQMRSQ